MDWHFNPAGSFAGAVSLADIPLPELHISGFGPVNLPLTQPDGMRLVHRARRSPFVHNGISSINDELRYCWEIDATDVGGFANEPWGGLVQDKITQVAVSLLGLETFGALPTCHLQKLYIYPEGSQCVLPTVPPLRN
jgi:hypothetical protein